ncbi:9095_t:CDS:2 [Funneliformis caledonium]|uniref:Phosphatidylglycerol/phosphatidylinositol transfer protein n=1 Tax=Funneliformis caledonium TaxID=1117310 RepID=A0A9N9D9R1_9GLOM|nr:9095_t:CDS:2 [Funneliformis caledonium]
MTTKFVPHLRSISSFLPCPPPVIKTPVPVLQVSHSTDPGQNNVFTVSGKFTKDVTDQTKLAVAFVNSSNKLVEDPTTVPACTGSGCPIKAGDQYTQTMEIHEPGNLTFDYILAFGVGNSVTDLLGCAYALVLG